MAEDTQQRLTGWQRFKKEVGQQIKHSWNLGRSEIAAALFGESAYRGDMGTIAAAVTDRQDRADQQPQAQQPEQQPEQRMEAAINQAMERQCNVIDMQQAARQDLGRMEDPLAAMQARWAQRGPSQQKDRGMSR